MTQSAKRISGRFIPVYTSEATVKADTPNTTLRRSGARHDLLAADVIAPMRGTEPLDLGFALFRAWAGVLIPLATVLYLPVQVFDLVLRLLIERPEETSLMVTSGLPIAALGGVRSHEPLTLFLQSVVLSLVGIGVGTLVVDMLANEVSTTRSIIRRTLKRIWVAPVIVILSGVVYLISSCVPVIGWALGGSLTFTASIVAGVERAGPLRSLRRSVSLARSAFSLALGLFVGGIVMLWLVRLLVLVGPVALLALSGAPGQLVDLWSSLAPMILVIIGPLTATLAAAAYLAMRVRCEGIDIRMRLGVAAIGEQNAI